MAKLDRPWEQVYTWFWYNDKEIFEWKQEDFDRKAKELAERGITLAITFSMTHFRFGYYPYWKEINDCIRKIVIACHKYDILVVEHHSAHLTLNLRTELGWKRLGEDLHTYGNDGCSLDHWTRMFPYLICKQEIEGHTLSEFVQIDGRTGEWAQNVYGAYSLCFNNEDYRKVYFAYLKDVVATGIDGIMNDDIQYFGDQNACTCPTCRRLFKEQTGYDLPDPAHWGEFFENYDNPAYIAWKKFKFASTTRMYRDLTAYYESLGVKLLRPNYSSDVLMHCHTCYSFDRCTDLWDLIFQENCFSAIIKQSYINFYTEAVHRYAAARRTGVPSASMFYPDRDDSVYFAWALARSWGQLYNATVEGYDITHLEKPFRDFEAANIRYYTAPDKIADVSFYFSQKTRDYTADAMVRYMHKFMGGMQAAYVSGLGVDMVFETDGVDELLRHGTVVLSHVAMMDEEELARFAEFVRRGGRLIILGECAIFKADGSVRTTAELEAAFGVAFAADKATHLGDGEVWRMTFAPDASEYQPTIWSARREIPPPAAEAVPSKWAMQKAGTGKVLRGIVAPKLTIDCANDRVVLTGYGVEQGLALHVMNLADTVAEEPCMTRHTDLIPHFMKDAARLPAMTLTAQLPAGLAATKATLRTPERADAVPLPLTVSGGIATITVPADTFAGYALIAVE